MRALFFIIIAVGYAEFSFSVPPKTAPAQPANKSSSSTSLNFDAEDVGAKRRDPLESIVTRNKVDASTSLVQRRTNWKDEINESMEYMGALPPLEMP